MKWRLWWSSYWPKNIAWPEEFVPAVTQGIHEKGVGYFFAKFYMVPSYKKDPEYSTPFIYFALDVGSPGGHVFC